MRMKVIRRWAGIAWAAVFLWVFPGSMAAADPATEPAAVQDDSAPSADALKRRINDILRQPEFKTTRTENEWRYLRSGEARQEPGAGAFLKWLVEAGRALAAFSEALLWSLVIVALILLVIHRSRWLGLFEARPVRQPPRLPDVISGLDVRPESLPDDIAGSAWALWQRGRAAASLSLLYRGALARLVADRRIELNSSATEEDCIRIVNSTAAPELARYFTELARAWQRTAYAGRIPQDAAAQSLCMSWERHFGKAR